MELRVFTERAFTEAANIAAGRNWLIADIPLPVFFSLVGTISVDLYYKATAQELFDAGVAFSRLPFIVLHTNSSGDAVVCWADGRHRGRVLELAGHENMPVIFLMGSQKGIKQEWPPKIYAHPTITKNPEFTIPLPPRLDP